MVVPVDRRRIAKEILADEIERNYQPCDPFDPRQPARRLASAIQVERVTEHVARAVADGARCVIGGPERPTGLGPGY